MTSLQRCVAAALLIAMALGLAAGARHGLVEPAHLTAHCDGGGISVACEVRRLVIQVFVHERLGWAAWALAAIALLTPVRWRRLRDTAAGATLVTASAGLVLYTTELCAPAVLFALVLWMQAPAHGRGRGHAPPSSASDSSSPA